MRSIISAFLITATMYADSIVIVDGVTVNETVIQPADYGVIVDLTFSSPVTGFDLNVYTRNTFDKQVCLQPLVGNTPQICLHGQTPSDPWNYVNEPGVNDWSFTFNFATAQPFTQADIVYSAISAGDVVDVPSLMLNSVSKGNSGIQTVPEAATPLLAAIGLLFIWYRVYGRKRNGCKCFFQNP